MSTNSIILSLALLLSATSAFAGDDPGFYDRVGRSNDPFVFCTYGNPILGNWMPIDAQSGTWTIVDPEWDWYNSDEVAEFEKTCPEAMGVGAWTGPGTGEMDPHYH
jgi:hypothetical protein